LINASTVQDVSLNQYMTMALANFVGFQSAEAKDRKYTAGKATGQGNAKKA
jgi:hypothetical protein